MPWLDLLAEDGDDAVAVLFQQCIVEWRIVYSLEELCAEGADIVEVYEAGSVYEARWKARCNSRETYKALAYALPSVELSSRPASGLQIWVQVPF